MYSSFQLARKYCKYFISAKNGKGHGIHSPFVYDFVTKILNDKKEYSCYKEIESLRHKLLHDDTGINVEDFGAGSALIPSKQRKIKDIARSSLKNKKFAQLLFRIAKYYQPENIIELGTSLGITTSYFANANKNAQIYTFEGSKEIAAVAQQNFNSLHLKNITQIWGNFDETLAPALSNISSVDLAFIDGNHRKEPTLRYFDIFLKKSGNNSIFIFDDIHWSAGMEEAWRLIQGRGEVTLTIDLFFIGVVCFNKDFKVKQHFSIRY
jgi:predicted O-methyltransferase YrrM